VPAGGVEFRMGDAASPPVIDRIGLYLRKFFRVHKQHQMKTRLFAIAIAFIITSFAHKDISWVAIGDSITYLNDHANETGNRVSKGYLSRVTEKLPYIHYTNQGHNGWTSGRIAQEIDKLGIEKADVYSVFLGTNDWWQGRPVGVLADYQQNTGNATVYGSFRIIINKLRSLNANAKIILITPMQRVDFVYINNAKNNAWGSYKEKNGQSLRRFAEAIDSIGLYEHFETVDLYNKSGMTLKKLVQYKRLKDPQTGVYKNYPYPDFIGIPFNPETDEYPYPAGSVGMTYDGLHPSDKGNAVIAKLLAKIMKKY
jgi:lysophospholipase L1-like esterase